MIFSSSKEINKLISKGMSIIYLKVTIEKNCRSQNFKFLGLKNSSSCQFLWSSNSRRNFLLQLKNQRSGSKSVCGFSIILILRGIMTL